MSPQGCKRHKFRDSIRQAPLFCRARIHRGVPLSSLSKRSRCRSRSCSSNLQHHPQHRCSRCHFSHSSSHPRIHRSICSMHCNTPSSSSHSSNSSRCSWDCSHSSSRSSRQCCSSKFYSLSSSRSCHSLSSVSSAWSPHVRPVLAQRSWGSVWATSASRRCKAGIRFQRRRCGIEASPCRKYAVGGLLPPVWQQGRGRSRDA
mmetsp:Transcript_65932/g.166190  ORF Transcript_65932/g.166190 Transcript_65932/m.166190 type:complete len:202 (-) Transcript_65932:14-619(-)